MGRGEERVSKEWEERSVKRGSEHDKQGNGNE